MNVNGNFGRVEVMPAGLTNIHPADVISFQCSKEVYTILTSDELILEQRAIVESALEDLGIHVDEADWETLQINTNTLH